jgi:ribosome-associated translation inhibitor RaiA
MPYSDESYDLRIELDAKGCELSAGEITKLEDTLDMLRKLVRDFPVSNLYITIVYHSRSNDYHVKTSLALPGKTLFTGDRDILVQPAFERCVHKLAKKVAAYKQRMHGDSKRAKQVEGTHQTITPTRLLDVETFNEAVEKNDYVAFRRAADMFEEPLNERIGRWIQRYPEIESRLGDSITIADIVEEVFLNAFELFPERPEDVPPGAWFEGLIDSSVQALLQSPDEEFANISFARSLLEE